MADLLLVDNDARIVELTSWFLERAGHTVTSALSYAAARGLLEGAQPDLLLADLELGEERGLEELPKLAEAGLLPPTLVVSGFLDSGLVEELMRIPGVVGTLAKPVDLATLEARVLEALDAAVTEPVMELEPQPRSESPAPAVAAELVPKPPPVAAPRPAPRAALSEPDEDGWVEIQPSLPERES